MFATLASTAQVFVFFFKQKTAYEIGADGPLFATRGGDTRLAVGAGYRNNDFVWPNYLTGTTIQGDEASRFAYAELFLPLIGPDSTSATAHRLELTAALRSEDYDSAGRVSTPKLGGIYGPNAAFTLRASWGKRRDERS